jgi:hypothetical protein
MQLARFLNSVFKKDGFILVDANLKVTLLEIQKMIIQLNLKF